MSTQQQETTQAVQTAPKKFEEGTVEQVLQKIATFQEAGELRFPPNYVPENAVRSAWLLIQETEDRNHKPALEVCTKASIANALLEMVLKGLSVVKKQCYFVVYGNKLELERSYMGEIAIAKRDAGVKDVNAVTIYEGDDFAYEIDPKTGRKQVVKHVQTMDNINLDKIKGAYAIVTYEDGRIDTEIMTMAQIRKAWAQGAAKGDSPAHRNFTDQMAEKTVINRALKIVNGSTDDSALMVNDQYPAMATVRNDIKQNANRTQIGFEDANVVDDGKDGAAPVEQAEPADHETPGVNGQPSWA
jgi:recombination protein RecT